MPEHEGPKTATEVREQTEAADRTARIYNLSLIIGAAIGRITDDTDIIVPALLRVMAVEVVTAPGSLTWEFKRANTHRHLRLALSEAKDIFDKAQAANNG